MSLGTGVVLSFFTIGGARLTDAVTYWMISYSWILFFSLVFGRDGYHIFKDLEAETIHVCIAWALLKYLGLFLVYFFCTYHSRLSCFPVYRFGDG